MFTGKSRNIKVTCDDLMKDFNNDRKKVSENEMTEKFFRSKWNDMLRKRPDCRSLIQQLNSLKSLGI